MIDGQAVRLCKRCRCRNDAGSFCCVDCGEPLLPPSEFITRPLAQGCEAQAATAIAGAGRDDPAGSLTYEGSAIPNEWYQQRLMDTCGEAMRQLIKCLNHLHYSYLTAPAAQRSGMNENRFMMLAEMKDLLSQFQVSVTILIAQEFKARN